MSDRFDDDIRAALGDLLDLAPPVVTRPSVPTRTAHTRTTTRPRLVLIGAAVAVSAVVATIVVIVRDGDPKSIGPAPTGAPFTSVSSPVTTVSSTPSASSTLPTVVPSEPTGMFVFDLPDGYEITHVEVTADTDIITRPGQVTIDHHTWVRTADDGSPELLVVSVGDTPDPTTENEANATAHGLPARLQRSTNGSPTVLRWNEGSWKVTMRSYQLDEQAITEVAELLSLSADTGAIAFADPADTAGFGPGHGTVADSSVVRMIVSAENRSTGGFITLVAGPDTDGLTNAELAAGRYDYLGDPHTVNGVDVVVNPGNVMWTQNGSVLQMNGSMPVDQVAQLAAGVHAVTLDELRAAVGGLVEQQLAVSPTDVAQFNAQGITIDVRAYVQEDRSVTICVSAPVQQCHNPSVNALTGAVLASFEIEKGVFYAIGWHKGAPGFEYPDASYVPTTHGVFVLFPSVTGEPRPVEFPQGTMYVVPVDPQTLLDF